MNMTKFLKNITTMLALATLVACSSGGSCPPNLPAQEAGKLVFVAPSILPSLANKTGINYMGVYNPSKTTINGISYNLGQQVGAGNSIVLDPASAKACASIAAQSSCFLKFSVPESTIAGGAVVTASNSSGAEAATPLAIGVQQVPYTESANANGVGLYFYPKAQYGANSVPFILVTAVVQSPNVGNINTIQLVDESGNVIPDQEVISGNSGAGKAALQMGDVVEISLPIPQGINLTQNFKVQTSSQSLVASALNSLANKLNFKSLEATTSGNISSATYTLTTQGNNINLQLTPNQVYLTQKNPVQYGYLYNIGDLTASQIKLTSSSSNVRVTAADTILNGQRVIKVTYELINMSVGATSNSILVTANNPNGQTESSTGGTSQNVNPLPVPTPDPTPTPTPSPTSNPGPIPPILQMTVTSSGNPVAGGSCSVMTATVPTAATAVTTVTFAVSPENNTYYGFGSASPYATTTTCTIASGETSCSTAAGAKLCASASATVGTALTVAGSASGYSDGTLSTLKIDPLGNFIAGDNAGNIYLSADGITWSSAKNIAGTSGITALAYGNGYYVAGDSAGKIYYSSDYGSSWTQATTANNPTTGTSPLYNGVHSITYGKYNGTTPTFLASDGGGFDNLHNGGYYYYSTNNGATWTISGGTTSDPSEFKSSVLAFQNNNFVGLDANGNTFVSTDGGTSFSTGSSLFETSAYNIVAGNGYFVAIGDSDTAGDIVAKYSSDGGSSWTSANTLVAGSGSVTALGYGNGIFLANDTPNGMSKSTDNGSNWVGPLSMDLGWINSIVYGGDNGIYLAGGNDGKVYRSTANAAPMFFDYTQVTTNQILSMAARVKHIFVTSGSWYGIDVGGIGGADAKCQADPQAGHELYKAMIVDGINRSAVSPTLNWVFQPNTNYYRVNTTTKIFTTNASAIFNFGTLDVSFGTVAAAPWTGLLNNWTWNSTNVCNGWNSDGIGSFGNMGDALATDSSSIYNGNDYEDCSNDGNNYFGNPHPLYCVQQ